MNCWKSFNITRDHGSIRLIIFSVFSMVTFFILFNIIVTTFLNVGKVVAFNPAVILVCLLLIVPFHKLAHCLPLWFMGKKANLTWERSIMVPVLNFHFRNPISKRLCLMVMIAPAILGTLLTVVFTWLTPTEMAYFGILGAINFGLSAADFIYISNLSRAPHNAFVEDDQDGCRILIKQTL